MAKSARKYWISSGKSHSLLGHSPALFPYQAFMSLQPVTTSYHYQAEHGGEGPALLCPDRQRNTMLHTNTAMPSRPEAPLSQQPLPGTGWCQRSQGAGALWSGQVKLPGGKQCSAVTFLQNREISCRTRYKTKKDRLMADHRRWEKSLWICSMWCTPRSSSSWRSLASPSFRELGLEAAV